MSQFFTYTVYHQDSGKVVAQNLFEASLVHLINKMIKEDIVKDINLVDYMNVPVAYVDISRLLDDIESQGVFIIKRRIHG